jgi:hypothetical protein
LPPHRNLELRVTVLASGVQLDLPGPGEGGQRLTSGESCSGTSEFLIGIRSAVTVRLTLWTDPPTLQVLVSSPSASSVSPSPRVALFESELIAMCRDLLWYSHVATVRLLVVGRLDGSWRIEVRGPLDGV